MTVIRECLDSAISDTMVLNFPSLMSGIGVAIDGTQCLDVFIYSNVIHGRIGRTISRKVDDDDVAIFDLGVGSETEKGVDGLGSVEEYRLGRYTVMCAAAPCCGETISIHIEAPTHREIRTIEEEGENE